MLAALQRRGRRDLPAQRLRQRRARAAPARAGPRGARRRPGLDLVGDLAAGQGVRARVDDGRSTCFMKLIFTATTPTSSTRELRGAGLRRRAELRRLRGDAAALARRRWSSRSGSSSPARRPARCRARASARRSASATCICADVGGTSTDISLVVDGQPFVNNTFELEHDLIINALSTEISSVGAGGGSIVSISPLRRRRSSGPTARARTPGRPATAAAARGRR